MLNSARGSHRSPDGIVIAIGMQIDNGKHRVDAIEPVSESCRHLITVETAKAKNLRIPVAIKLPTKGPDASKKVFWRGFFVASKGRDQVVANDVQLLINIQC